MKKPKLPKIKIKMIDVKKVAKIARRIRKNEIRNSKYKFQG